MVRVSRHYSTAKDVPRNITDTTHGALLDDGAPCVTIEICELELLSKSLAHGCVGLLNAELPTPAFFFYSL